MFLPIFEHCASAVITFIQESEKSLKIAVCWFTHPGIFKSLLQASLRGVHVEIIVNYDQINFCPNGLDFQKFAKKVAIYGYTGPGLLHHKMAVADDSKILTGSYNWTRAEQSDHLLTVESPQLAQQFTHYYDSAKKRSKRLEELRDTPLNRTNLMQLHTPVLWSVNDIRKRVVAGAKSWQVICTEKDWSSFFVRQECILPIPAEKVVQLSDIHFQESELLKKWLSTALLSVAKRSLIARFCLRVKPGDVIIAVTKTQQLLGVGLIGGDPFLQEDGFMCRYVQWLPYKGVPVHTAGTLEKSKVAFLPFKGSVLALLIYF